MKPFRFKKFTVQQHKEVFRVGTDGVLLGALADCSGAKHILEVGTGTGLVALMTAQRNLNGNVTAIDVNPVAAELAAKNFSESLFGDRMRAMHRDYKAFDTQNKFDLIISNPPYFETNPSEKDATARQQRELSFKSLISKTAEILAPEGRFCVIIPFPAGPFFEKICEENKLFVLRRLTVYGNANVEPKRLILEFSFNENISVAEETFVTEKAPRVYSEQYLKATADFHEFG